MLIVVPTLDRMMGITAMNRAYQLAGLENVRAVVAVDENRSGWTRNVNRYLPTNQPTSLPKHPTTSQLDDVCILNDDCDVRIGWLATLWDELEQRKDCWFAGPSGPCRTPPQNTGHPNDERAPMVVSHCAGFCLVIKREAISALGPLDETFRHYGSDVDYQWRAEKDFGKKTLWVPSVWVNHGLHAPHEPWYTMDNFTFWKRWSNSWTGA